ncbi:MAG: glycine--tRNA ligase subunit beta, partial [Alphaproteobacteria bacterium]
MAELLLELLSEEIPARMQARAAEDLKRLVTDKLKEAGLDFEHAEAYVTPRRLALVVDGLPLQQPDVTEERKGPRVDAPEKAIQGFLGSVGLTLDQVGKRETPKGEFYFARIEKKGLPTELVLEDLVTRVVRNFPWPKSMKWGVGHGPWVRPIHNIICRFGPAESIVITLEPGKGFRTTETVGHPFHAPEWFAVKDFADYKAKLAKAKVMLDGAERRATILAEAEKLARTAKLTLKPDDGLLDENAGLVEWPVVLMGRIDEAFMDLPAEVLTTVMRHHQKYFALLDGDGNLAPRFILVANTETRDKGKAIVAGNERVLRARLADARFFWDQDRKERLEDRVSALAKRIFHAELGSVAEKVERTAKLARELAGYADADSGLVERAARLCKADLSTEMVGEFPELQGVMGRYYALNDGEKPEVADAIAEHYSPQGPDDRCPTAPVGVAVALADKIDTLVGFFAIGEKPTGSKDPYAVRRAALGVIRLIIENNLRLPLTKLFGQANHLYAEPETGFTGDLDPQELLDFFAERLKVHLKEQGVAHDLISAVFALGGEDDLVRLLARVDALKAFLESDDGEHLLTAYKRASNIVRIEEKRDGKRYNDAPLS